MTDSLLSAAKKTTLALGLEWKDVQGPYAELLDTKNGDGLLPKSSGRQVWAANPNYISRLLIAIAWRGSLLTCKESVLITWALTPNGRNLSIDEYPSSGSLNLIEGEFREYLVNIEAAKSLEHVEFDLTRRSIKFVSKSSEEKIFLPADDITWRDDEPFSASIEAALGKDTHARLQTRILISGVVFEEIASTVEWRISDHSPLI